MLETLWAMTKLFFLFGILPTGVLLLIYLFLEKHLKITDAVIKLIENSGAELIRIGAAFIWLCFFGFAGYIIYLVVR
jgi:hypothetical protein